MWKSAAQMTSVRHQCFSFIMSLSQNQNITRPKRSKFAVPCFHRRFCFC